MNIGYEELKGARCVLACPFCFDRKGRLIYEGKCDYTDL